MNIHEMKGPQLQSPAFHPCGTRFKSLPWEVDIAIASYMVSGLGNAPWTPSRGIFVHVPRLERPDHVQDGKMQSFASWPWSIMPSNVLFQNGPRRMLFLRSGGTLCGFVNLAKTLASCLVETLGVRVWGLGLRV